MSRENQEVADRVVQAVAAASDVDPLALPPLYDAIGPDTLGAVVERMAEGDVFTYAECEVTVAASETIDVEGSGPMTRSTGTVPPSN